MKRTRTRRPAPNVDAFDFSEDRLAVVIEADTGTPDARWLVWHIRTDDTDPIGWVRRDWLHEVERGFQFGDETAIEGFNWFPEAVA